MKFRDFLLKHLLADTDYLVGYNADGEYIRISKQDLISTLSSAVTAQSIEQQFSSNGSSWHNSYTEGDSYMRVKTGASSWTPAIKLSVSAYDIWLEQGGVGTEEDFLASIKGEAGDAADLTGVTIQNIAGYSTFLQNVNESITNAKSAIIEEVKEEAKEAVMSQFSEMQLSDMLEVKSVSEADKFTIFTDNGARKISIESLAGNIANKLTSSKIVSGGSGKPLTASVEVEVTDWETTEDGYTATVNLPGMTKDALVQASAAPESMMIWMDTPFYLSEVKDDAVVLSAETRPAEEVIYNLLYWK